MGKLIVIEGLDGSGKATQANLLFERLEKNNLKVKKVTFPDYESDSSAPVRMYLAGKLELTPAQCARADANYDGVVDVKDVTLIQMYLVQLVDKLG